jgi:O-antigen/teichoic acid export membrane protein
VNTKKILQFSIGPIAAAVLGLVTLPIVAWLFSPEDIGRLTMLNITISFALLLFSLGLDQAYVREFHEVEDRPALLKAVFLPGFLALTTILFALIFLPWSLSELLFGVDSTLLTGLLLAAIFVSFFSRFLSLILRMQEKGLAFSMSRLLPKLLFLMIVVGYAWFGAEAIFENLMLANLSSLLAVFLIFAWNTKKDWIPALSATIDKTKQSQMIRYAIPLIGSGLAFWGLTAMDKIFLRSLSNFEELGIYSISVSFASAALVFQAIFSTVWVPIVYKWAADGVDPRKINNVVDYVTLAVIVIWSMAGMFSWVITYILPLEYVQVQSILLAAMAYPLLYALSEATGVGIGIKRKTMYSMLATVVALAINAAGNWLLIPGYGAAGAAMASAIAFFVFFAIRTEASARIWESFKRVKMYSFILLALSAAVIINLIEISIIWQTGLSLSFLLFGLLAYKKQVGESVGYIKLKIRRDAVNTH